MLTILKRFQRHRRRRQAASPEMLPETPQPHPQYANGYALRSNPNPRTAPRSSLEAPSSEEREDLFAVPIGPRYSRRANFSGYRSTSSAQPQTLQSMRQQSSDPQRVHTSNAPNTIPAHPRSLRDVPQLRTSPEREVRGFRHLPDPRPPHLSPIRNPLSGPISPSMLPEMGSRRAAVSGDDGQAIAQWQQFTPPDHAHTTRLQPTAAVPHPIGSNANQSFASFTSSTSTMSSDPDDRYRWRMPGDPLGLARIRYDLGINPAYVSRSMREIQERGGYQAQAGHTIPILSGPDTNVTSSPDFNPYRFLGNSRVVFNDGPPPEPSTDPRFANQAHLGGEARVKSTTNSTFAHLPSNIEQSYRTFVPSQDIEYEPEPEHPPEWRQANENQSPWAEAYEEVMAARATSPTAPVPREPDIDPGEAARRWTQDYDNLYGARDRNLNSDSTNRPGEPTCSNEEAEGAHRLHRNSHQEVDTNTRTRNAGFGFSSSQSQNLQDTNTVAATAGIASPLQEFQDINTTAATAGSEVTRTQSRIPHIPSITVTTAPSEMSYPTSRSIRPLDTTAATIGSQTSYTSTQIIHPLNATRAAPVPNTQYGPSQYVPGMGNTPSITLLPRATSRSRQEVHTTTTTAVDRGRNTAVRRTETVHTTAATRDSSRSRVRSRSRSRSGSYSRVRRVDDLNTTAGVAGSAASSVYERSDRTYRSYADPNPQTEPSVTVRRTIYRESSVPAEPQSSSSMRASAPSDPMSFASRMARQQVRRDSMTSSRLSGATYVAPPTFNNPPAYHPDVEIRPASSRRHSAAPYTGGPHQQRSATEEIVITTRTTDPDRCSRCGQRGSGQTVKASRICWTCIDREAAEWDAIRAQRPRQRSRSGSRSGFGRGGNFN